MKRCDVVLQTPLLSNHPAFCFLSPSWNCRAAPGPALLCGKSHVQVDCVTPSAIKTGRKEGAPGLRLGKESLVLLNADPLWSHHGAVPAALDSLCSFLGNIKLGKGVKPQINEGWTLELATRSVIQSAWQVLGIKILMFLQDDIKYPEKYLPFMGRMSRLVGGLGLHWVSKLDFSELKWRWNSSGLA